MTEFVNRHIGSTEAEQQEMLSALGYKTAEDLVLAAVPAGILAAEKSDSVLPTATSETAALAELRSLANKNRVTTSLIGQGYYGTITPEVIKRNVLENPSWYTAYTPYQPEVSQGRLEALLNFQTMVTDLTGLSWANSSMLDESSAVAEAMLLARRANKTAANKFFYDAELYPQSKAVLLGRAVAVGISAIEVQIDKLTTDDFAEAFGIVIQYPATSGAVRDLSAILATAKAAGTLSILSSDLLALTLLKSPGELGADIAVGSSQRFGVPMGFGGPHAGYMSVRAGLERQLPGRLVGVSQDAAMQPAYRLTLQAREQHIRREKATSNICTAQVLLAVMASMYAVYHGPVGLKQIASRVHAQAAEFAGYAGDSVLTKSFFDTVTIAVHDADAAYADLRAKNLTAYRVDAQTIRISFDEATAENPELAKTIASVLGFETQSPAGAKLQGIPEQLLRKSSYLSHPVFNTHSSETRLMRYLKHLADLDYALDRGMIPLGSCTMKLSAAAEMASITWPEFANLHPFAPAEDVTGSLELITELQSWLAELTGYDTVSVQPNAGSQGELSGLLAIRGYHLSRGDENRNICLIPSSAHGTNAASAVLAGMKVVVVACDELGNVDLGDLNAKIAEYSDSIAALMITYPSTHGVYEQAVREICAAVHEAGGQVYVDGANLNALVGFAKFGEFGGDVSHLNLHKTFAIPHGGGGPGVGPVVAKAHLAQFLPGHPLAQKEFHQGAPVSAAPYGSASILPIPWAYIRMLGNSGLRQATAGAVLTANYVAKRLGDIYPVLYTGKNGLVAHECILDMRAITAESGVTAEDIAKRLIDYGFHAPTMSFPVAGTLMVEPTESEDLVELERFILAMRAIHAEILAVQNGEVLLNESVLRNAPHTAQSLIGDWNHPYSREQAVYPFAAYSPEPITAIRSKYWAPVRRIDNTYGDRNLVCACPPIEAFAANK